ncbi:MAG: PHP domain-containing protein [Treponema sp.]|nr:PHP domain-containing protein [Treponema sp.]
MIDFHVHTTASDGQYSPKELILKAKEKNLTAVAITDHDSVSGLEEGEEAAKTSGIRFIRGTELNIQYPTGEFHLLGLGLKELSPALKTLLENLQNNRSERNRSMFEKLQELFPSLSWEELEADFPETSLGRPHFARYLVKKGIVNNNQVAFDKYLGKGRLCYVPRTGANLDEAVVAINESGGVPVIAHPMSLFVSWGKLPEVLEDFYERGVMGLEAFHPGARNSECFRLNELGRKIGYFITGASDFHGEKIRKDRKLGHTCGGRKIDSKLIPEAEDLVERLKVNW